MPTRYNSRSRPRFNVSGLESGYGSKSAPVGFTIPPVGIGDVDLALFNLFNEEIPFTVCDDDGQNSRKVPVIFAAGEKWALNKRMRAVRDRNNALILPLITAIRTIVQQTPNDDVAGRGINQQTGEIVIQRRLDKSDRGYQQLINRLLVGHQSNLVVSPTVADQTQLTSLRSIGDLSQDPVVVQGGVLVPDRTNNVYETIVVPAPQFFTAQYDVTIWTQYTLHMNQLIEQLIASFLPQGNCWRIDSPKGYWFVATIDSNTYTSDTNTDDYSQVERLIKYKFVVKVPGYILASGVPGSPVPIKRYVSSPTISFTSDIAPGITTSNGSIADPFLGADDPTLQLTSGDDAPNKRRDQRYTNGTRLYPNVDVTNPDDPALKQLPRGSSVARYKKIVGIDRDGNKVTQYLRVKSQNQFTGETVLSAADASLGGLTIVVDDG